MSLKFLILPNLSLEAKEALYDNLKLLFCTKINYNLNSRLKMSNNIALFLIVLILFLMLISMSKIQESLDIILKKKYNNILISIFIILGVFAVVFGIFAPSFLTNIENTTTLQPNEIGDTYGGTMGPFIAIGGVIFTFLAFYMQKLPTMILRNSLKFSNLKANFMKCFDFIRKM